MPGTAEDPQNDLFREQCAKLSAEEHWAVLESLPPEERRKFLECLPLEERLGGLSAEQLRQHLDRLTAASTTDEAFVRPPQRELPRPVDLE